MATFEEQLTALEAVVEQLERGELTLEDSVRLFEEGVRLSAACKQRAGCGGGKDRDAGGAGQRQDEAWRNSKWRGGSETDED